MVDATHHGDGQPTHPSVRYERTDANFRWILIIILGAMGFAALVHYTLLVYYGDQLHAQATVKKSPFPLAPSPSTALPREPRLEQLDRLAGVETPNVYERETARLDILNSYGPTSEEGFIRIPIDKAMGLLADKLPHREAPSAEQQRRSSGLVDSGESNSGHMFRGRPR
jgi:hypothetical protein